MTMILRVLLLTVLYLTLKECHGMEVTSLSKIPCPPCTCYHRPEGEFTANCTEIGKDFLPESIPANITYLIFGGNNLKNLSQGMFKRFTLLKCLDVSNNNILGIDVHAFDGLRNLLLLNMHTNKLHLNNSTYPVGLFKPLMKLRTLDLSKNDDKTRNRGARYMYNQEAFVDLDSLQELLIDGIENATFGDVFKKMKRLTSLTLSGYKGYCSILNLFNTSFMNLPNIEYLDISNCKMLGIEVNTFWPMRKMKVLNVSSNEYLTLDKFGLSLYGLRSSRLRVLNASWIMSPFYTQGVHVLMSTLLFLNTTTVEELYLDGNGIETFDAFVPTLMKHLKILSLERNRFRYGLYIFALDPLVSLEKIDISHQDSSMTFPFTSSGEITYYHEKVSHKPRSKGSVVSKEKGLDVLSLDFKIMIPIPRNLRYIDARHSDLSGTVGEVFFTKNNINVVEMSYNLFTSLQGPLHNVQTVEFMDFSYNFLNNISSRFFEEFLNLRYLNLGRNYLENCLHDDNSRGLFINQMQLEMLHISSNNIHYLSPLLFQNLTSLRHLDVSLNELSSWSPSMSHMLHLELLDLSNNRFENIPVQLRKDIDNIISKRYQKLDMKLRGNILKCDCGNLDSLQWMNEAYITISDLNLTNCKMKRGGTVYLSNLNEVVLQLQKQCHTVLPLTLGAAAGITVFLICVAAGIVYRYRWKLRYLYYTTKRKYKGYQRQTREDDKFVYDAFVSYADEDRQFVVEDMRDVLERKLELKLCIHHRDFMVGEAITANIINAVQSSRKTIVLLSPNFLKSSWCDYEVHMAKLESIYTGRDVLCVVWYIDVPNHRAISDDLMEEMASGTYIKYPTHEAGKELFWQSLKDALTNP